MKNNRSWLLFLASLTLTLTCQTEAQILKVLHSFTTLSNSTNMDGAAPSCGLVLSSNTLYGTTESGGLSGSGAVFSVNIDGTGFTNLHNFTGTDGDAPRTDLTLSGRTLYGTTTFGGLAGGGTIFQITTDGSGFTNIYNFPVDDLDGLGRPVGPLVLSSNLLYGSSFNGGIFKYGTLYVLTTDGTAFTNLFTFAGGADGGFPSALILSNGTLYGTSYGGNGLNGTVFSLQTGGVNVASPNFIHNFALSDGTTPRAGLVLAEEILYGTTTGGGANGEGTIFSINTDGSGFTTMYSFSPVTFIGNTGTYAFNPDGFQPEARLVLSGSTLYGTTYTGGPAGNGTVFAINTDGTGFTNLYSFSTLITNTNSDGANPRGGLVLSGNTLFGTTVRGGAFGNGTVFKISLTGFQPTLAINLVDGNVVLTWPTNAVGFLLQSATNLIPPVSWAGVLSPTFVVNGQNTVTNRVFSRQQFYRLSQ